MYIKYKNYVGNKEYANEIGEFKYAWYSTLDNCLIIGIKEMEDIFLPVSIEESNLLINKLFAAFKNNFLVELTGLCFAESLVNDFLKTVDENKNEIDDETEAFDEDTDELLSGYDIVLDTDGFLDFVREERRYTPEAYDVKVNGE